MSTAFLSGAAATAGRREGEPPRVAFAGPASLIDDWVAPVRQLTPSAERFQVQAGDDSCRALDQARAFDGEVTVVLDPTAFPAAALAALPGITLGVISEPPSSSAGEESCAAVDRIVCFDPALTGTAIGEVEVWRAIPPPVGDALFADARPLHRAPRAMSIGSSTAHREAMLMPAKHHHDLLQIVHGVSGDELAELLAEYDVGVHVGREWGGDFGWSAAAHLAAGQLLLSEPLRPAHGLEENIDYLRFESPEDLQRIMDALARFPETYGRIRVRGRMKAEHFRASRTFARIVHDVILDVAAFGRSRRSTRS